MPIKIAGKTFHSFAAAVRFVMRWKKISKAAATRYVGKVESKQRARYKKHG